MTLTRTYTRTHTVTQFADPYKICDECGQWIDGVLDAPGPLILVPCMHQASYTDLCPSWAPVDGCSCVESFGRRLHPERSTCDARRWKARALEDYLTIRPRESEAGS